MPGTSPGRRTGALAAGLALTGALLAAGAPTGPVLTGAWSASPWLLAGALAVLFGLAELCLLHVEVRREAYSVTLAGVPLVLGLLVCGARELVLARVLGSAVAFTVQRTARLKAGYNLAAYGFEAAVDVSLLHLLVRPHPVLTLQTAVTCLAVLLAVDQIMSLLVTVVIGWHQGALTARQRAEVHLPALVWGTLATAGAYGTVLLTAHGAVGLVVIGIALVSAGLAYRAFQVLHRRHQALGHVHDFVGLTTGDLSVPELARCMLEQIRTLMRAGAAELLLTDPDAPLHLMVDELGATPPAAQHRRRGDDGQHPAPVPGPAVLTRTTRDRTQSAWLQERGVRDAVVVPLPGPGATVLGTLMVLGRLGDTGSFTAADQTLLQTLAGHLAVAVSSGRRRDLLLHDATHDGLTGLGNRALLTDAITRQIADPLDGRAAVLLLDLDRFKEVNDTLGHHVGDALLMVVAERLRGALPAGATVVRLGGDEFAALLPRVTAGHDDNQPPAGAEEVAREVAQAAARQVAAALSRPVDLPEATVSTRASIGVAVAAAGCDGSDLLRHADTAMYAAKETRAGVVVYSAELDRGRAERLALLGDLHLALARHELSVYYQPKLELASGRITSIEALVRWEHPRLGLLSPDAFIPLAESNGLVARLTALVLAAALEQCAAWRAEGLDVAVAVNLSARTVNEIDLPERISAALLTAGVPASALILEITESAIMDDPERAVTILERIAAIGVGLSLDDFGTGYSSLSYLQQLPVSEVKVDRSFICRLTTNDANSQVLVRSIIGLGSSLGLRVVAEGVEDAPTLELLRELGCHLVQGYHISPPRAAADLISLLHGDRRHRRLRAVAG